MIFLRVDGGILKAAKNPITDPGIDPMSKEGMGVKSTSTIDK